MHRDYENGAIENRVVCLYFRYSFLIAYPKGSQAELTRSAD